MAILWCDSFNSYGTTADATKSYGTNTDSTRATINLTGGPDSSPCASLVGTNGTLPQLVTTPYATAASTIIGGRCRFKQSAISTAAAFVTITGQSASGTAADWSIGSNTTTGFVYVTLHGSASVLASGSTNIADNVYRVIEWQVRSSDTVGTIKVWVDGVLEINSTGSPAGDTFAGTAHATLPWGGSPQIALKSTISSVAATRLIDDLIIFDDAGGAGTLRTTDQPFGNLVIATLRPSGAGTTTNFTPSAGSNFQCVDEVAQNGATDYVSSATSGHRDLYAMGNMGVVPTTVYGYVAKVYADNPGGGTISMKQTLKSGATTTTSTTTIANLGGDYVVTCYDTDPNGSIAWTQTNVDAVEQGFDVV